MGISPGDPRTPSVSMSQLAFQIFVSSTVLFIWLHIIVFGSSILRISYIEYIERDQTA